MKQVIFLGFYCQIYKKAPTARIYVGDTMIDEIEIPEFYTEEYIRDGQLSFLPDKSIDSQFLLTNLYMSPNEMYPSLYEKIHPLDRYWWEKEGINHITFEEFCKKIDPKNKTLTKIKHPKIFVYVIDDEILKLSQYKLRIEIKNSDSNYANGFMSKSTLLYLSTFYMMPYTLFENPIDYTEKFLKIYSRKTTACELKKIVSWYRRKIIWPLNLNLHFKLIDNKKQEKGKLDPVFGGDATLEIAMKKKYGIYWPEKTNPRGFILINRFFVKDFVVGLMDK